MQELSSYLAANRETFGLSPTGPVFVELHAPQWISRLNRCIYLVRVGSEAKFSLVLQRDRSMMGHPCSVNPYEPDFQGNIASLLVKLRGAFSLGQARYYWAEFLRDPCLLDVLKSGQMAWDENLCAVADAILELQAEKAFPAKSPLAHLSRQIQEKIDDCELSASWESNSQALWSLASSFPLGLGSWSHGDLWPKEIFLGNGFNVLIDWEWSACEAPLGADVIDLYLTSAQHAFGVAVEDSWVNLLNNSFPKLSTLHRRLSLMLRRSDPSMKTIPATLLYCLLRWWGREVAQDGRSALAKKEKIYELAQRIAQTGACKW